MPKHHSPNSLSSRLFLLLSYPRWRNCHFEKVPSGWTVTVQWQGVTNCTGVLVLTGCSSGSTTMSTLVSSTLVFSTLQMLCQMFPWSAASLSTVRSLGAHLAPQEQWSGHVIGSLLTSSNSFSILLLWNVTRSSHECNHKIDPHCVFVMRQTQTNKSWLIAPLFIDVSCCHYIITCRWCQHCITVSFCGSLFFCVAQSSSHCIKI